MSTEYLSLESYSKQDFMEADVKLFMLMISLLTRTHTVDEKYEFF